MTPPPQQVTLTSDFALQAQQLFARKGSKVDLGPKGWSPVPIAALSSAPNPQALQAGQEANPGRALTPEIYSPIYAARSIPMSDQTSIHGFIPTHRLPFSIFRTPLQSETYRMD